MPIYMPRDTRDVLGDFANKCDCRSLLQERFPFFDRGINEARRLGLDLWVDNVNDQSNDISKLSAKAATEAANLEYKLRRTDLDPGKRTGIQRELMKQQSLQKLCVELLKGRSPWQMFPPHREWVRSLIQESRTFILPTFQRLAVGLANGVVENAGLTLHRRFGYPLIPGRAAKGLAADGAIDLQADAELRRLALGADENDTDSSSGQAGAVSFLDAVAEEAKLELDILTPHYNRYYGGTGNPQALDEEAPVPNVFPVIAVGARFRFDLLLVPHRSLGRFGAKEILDATQIWLTHALKTFGAGGKTRAGYGRFGDKSAPTLGMGLFPDLATTRSPEIVSGVFQADSRSPVERCVANWRGKVSTYSFDRLVSDLAILNGDELRQVVPHLFEKQHLNADETPANPLTSPFWKAFSKVPGGSDLLEKLTRTAK